MRLNNCWPPLPTLDLKKSLEGGGIFKVFEWNKSNILKGNWLRLPKFASVGIVLNLPDLRYILLTLFDYNSLCCRSPSKTIFMYLNTLRVPLACHEAIMSHRDLHSSKITTIHQHLGPKRQNFKIQNPGSESQNHPKSKSPAHIQSVKPKIKTKNKQMKVFEWNTAHWIFWKEIGWGYPNFHL